jgi:hypothetical protein
MEYRIQQKATIWYETTVQADSPEQAIEKVQNGETDDWEQVLDTTEMLDTFWWQDENDNEGEIDNEQA